MTARWHWLAQLPKTVIVMTAGVLLLVLGLIDYRAGHDVAISAFYLLPICWTTWYVGRTCGVTFACLAVLVWLICDWLNAIDHNHPFVLEWNAIMLLILFLSVVYLLAAFQSAKEHLETTVARRTQALQNEVTERERAQERLLESNRELAASREKAEDALVQLQRSHDELKVAQWQLLEAAKMESVGRLAAGIAHEVKNPLAVVGVGAAYLKQHLPVQDENVGNTLREIEAAVDRADAVVSDLLDLSTPRELELKPQVLNGLIEKSLAMVRHELMKTRIKTELELCADAPALWLDNHKMEQVLINLFTNAIHAMSRGGTLTVRTRLGEKLATEPNRAAVAIEVDDTGVGVPEGQLARIFDPFFTTKTAGQGTGLGLTVSRKIVQLHGGTITAYNRPEGGFRVRILLPV